MDDTNDTNDIILLQHNEVEVLDLDGDSVNFKHIFLSPNYSIFRISINGEIKALLQVGSPELKALAALIKETL